MKTEMQMLEEMVNTDRIRDIDRQELISALERSERSSVWEKGAYFDPRRFRAQQQSSFSQTLLDDVLRSELHRSRRQIRESDQEIQRLEENIGSIAAAPTSELEDLDVIGVLHRIHGKSGLGALQDLLAAMALPDFSECEAFGADGAAGLAEGVLSFCRTVWNSIETRSCVDAGGVRFLRLHPFGIEGLEITSTPDLTDTVEVTLEAVGEGPSEDDARARAEEIEIWDQVEADRLWLRVNILPGSSGHANLRLRVPVGMEVRGSGVDVLVRDFVGDLHLVGSRLRLSNVRGGVTIGTDIVGMVQADGITGSISVETAVAPVSITNSRADVEVRVGVGDIHVGDTSGGISAVSTHGDIDLEEILTSRMSLDSRSGSINFKGSTLPGGHYTAKTIKGHISIALDERSDCGLITETDEGSLNWTLEPRNMWDRNTEGSKRRYANVRLGSGCFTATSKSGDITVAAM